MLRFILSAAIVSLLASCANMSGTPGSGRASSSTTMGAPGGMDGYGPNGNSVGGPN